MYRDTVQLEDWLSVRFEGQARVEDEPMEEIEGWWEKEIW